MVFEGKLERQISNCVCVSRYLRELGKELLYFLINILIGPTIAQGTAKRHLFV
jgi:hypothetical protein